MEFYFYGLAIGAIFFLLRNMANSSHSKKFTSLGDMKGMPKSYIISKVGNPQSIETTDNGETILHWELRDYFISLLFDSNENMVRIVKQGFKKY